jgi:hypothetical protein
MANDLMQYRAAIGMFNNRNGHNLSKRCFFTIPLSRSIKKLIALFKGSIKALLILHNQLAPVKLEILFITVLIILSGDIETNPGPDSHGALQIVHLNVNGLRDKRDIVESHFDLFDIICITETHLNANISSDSVKIPGFHPIIRRDRELVSNRPSWGGVAIFIKDTLAFTRLNNLEDNLLENIWIRVHTKDNILLSVFYRPPSSLVKIWDNISVNIETAMDSFPRSSLIITGDFNENLLDNSRHHLSDIINSLGLSQIVTEPTRPASLTLLDLVITNHPGKIKDCQISAPVCSDHSPVAFKFTSVHKFKTPCYTRKIWLYKDADWENFRQNLRSSGINDLTNINDIDILTDLFTAKLLEAASKSIPNKNVSIRPRDKPWMTNQIRREMRKRERFFKHWKKNLNPTNRLKFTQQRNIVIQLVRKAKNEYITKLQSRIANKPLSSKEWWKTCKEIYKGTFDGPGNIPPLLNDKNEYVYSNLEKATLLNSYFTGIASLNDDNVELPPLTILATTTLDTIAVKETDVLKILANIDTGKALGPDLISPRLLYHSRDIIAPVLTNLINKSLIQGKVPTKWKTANVIPIHKKGDKSIPSNYRPISLLSCASKVMERAVFQHLYSYLQSFITSHQSGFLPNHSTVTQLLEIYHNITEALDKQKEIFFIFFDISKAFDRVWHRGLVFKLQQLGISGNVLQWISNYLTNRQQQVTIEAATSDTMSITAGVPQGSVLGPLLFLIYINDLPVNVTSNLYMFADDTCLYVSSKNLPLNENQLSNDLREITTWANRWLVDFNPNKTTSMLISRKHNQTPLQLTMDDQPIQNFTTHKHLGVIFNNRGTWSDHINTLLENANKKLAMLRGIKYLVNRKTLEIMYKSFVRPSLEYADIVWDNLYTYESNRLEIIQLQALRTITGLTISAHKEAIYTESGFQTLSNRRKDHRLTQMYKIKYDMAPQQLKYLLPPQTHERSQYNTRNKYNYTPYKTKTELFKGSFFPKTIADWTKLPPNLQNAETLSKFKSMLNKNTKPPEWFYLGERKLNIMLCQMRNACSSLKDDLFNNHVILDPKCSCTFTNETAEHYLLHCPKYTQQRARLNQEITQIIPNINITTQLLLFGDASISVKSNNSIILACCKFIKSTERFT